MGQQGKRWKGGRHRHRSLRTGMAWDTLHRVRHDTSPLSARFVRALDETAWPQSRLSRKPSYHMHTLVRTRCPNITRLLAQFDSVQDSALSAASSLAILTHQVGSPVCLDHHLANPRAPGGSVHHRPSNTYASCLASRRRFRNEAAGRPLRSQSCPISSMTALSSKSRGMGHETTGHTATNSMINRAGSAAIDSPRWLRNFSDSIRHVSIPFTL